MAETRKFSTQRKDRPLEKSLALLRERGLLKKIKKPVLPSQIAAYQKETNGALPLLFEDVRLLTLTKHRGFTFKVATGLCSSRKLISLLLHCRPQELMHKLLNSMSSQQGKVVRLFSDFNLPHEVVKVKVNLFKYLPLIKHHPEENAPYITSGIVMVHDPERDFFNLSFHRMAPISSQELVVRVVEGRDLHRILQKAKSEGQNLPVSVLIGVDVPVMLAAATSIREKSELEVASALASRSLHIAPCETVEAYALVESEIILEGEILTDREEMEGPFVELAGVDMVRKQPVLKVKAINMRQDPIYYDIFPSGIEHALLMGLPREPTIYAEVDRHVEVCSVRMSPAGMFWLEVILQIEKRDKSDPLTAAIAAIHAHPSVKSVIVIDGDVKIDDYVEVRKAVLTRSYPPLDYYILMGTRGSSLDHTNIRRITVRNVKSVQTLEVELPKAKIIIDATKKNCRHS